MNQQARTMQGSARQGATAGGRRAVLVASALLWMIGLGAVGSARGQGVDFAPLHGRWQRNDGGYILEVRAVDAGGKIDAAYLNPQPINVARAEATKDGSVLKVFVELRAPNYPGSTYTLAYDPKQDQLRGSYFQAVQQQTFPVVFVRMK
jgi:hypothetical protein